VSRVSATTARDTRGEAAEEGGGATKHLDRERERSEFVNGMGNGPEREETDAWTSLGPVHGRIGLAQGEFAYREGLQIHRCSKKENIHLASLNYYKNQSFFFIIKLDAAFLLIS
jgi:hypothetical protein